MVRSRAPGRNVGLLALALLYLASSLAGVASGQAVNNAHQHQDGSSCLSEKKREPRRAEKDEKLEEKKEMGLSGFAFSITST